MTGAGTEGDPYIVSSLADLQAVHDNLAAYYELANDIDASDTSTWNGGAGFSPIGLGSAFTGRFDGMNYKITDLYINRPTTNYIGLFSNLSAALGIFRLSLIDVNITGQFTVGGMIGTISGGEWNGQCCFVSGSVHSTDVVAGMFAGSGGLIRRCGVEGSVICDGRADTEDYAGGFVGQCVQDILDCYSRASALGAYGYIGGFSGGTSASGNQQRCYSTGAALRNSTPMKGFNGYNDEASRCYWDTETSGCSSSEGGTGYTTAQMKLQASYVTYDFDTIWEIVAIQNGGYPRLQCLPYTYEDVYPSDTIARVSSIRHIYRPGFYRMEVGLGALGFDIDVAEAIIRRAVAAEISEAEKIPTCPPGTFLAWSVALGWHCVEVPYE